MTVDMKTCCQWRVSGGQPWNPTSAKTGQIWGTRHSLRIKTSLPDHRFPRGVCEQSGLENCHNISRHLHCQPVKFLNSGGGT